MTLWLIIPGLDEWSAAGGQPSQVQCSKTRKTSYEMFSTRERYLSLCICSISIQTELYEMDRTLCNLGIKACNTVKKALMESES